MGQGLNLLLALLWAQTHQISRGRMVQYGTWFYFQFCLAASVNPLPLRHPLSFQCLSVLSAAAISWTLASGRSDITPQSSGPAFSGCFLLCCLACPLLLAHTPTSTSALRQHSRRGFTEGNGSPEDRSSTLSMFQGCDLGLVCPHLADPMSIHVNG